MKDFSIFLFDGYLGQAKQVSGFWRLEIPLCCV